MSPRADDPPTVRVDSRISWLLSHPDVCGARARGNLALLLEAHPAPEALTADRLAAVFARAMLDTEPDDTGYLNRFRARARPDELPAANRAAQVAAVLAAIYSRDAEWRPPPA